MIEKFIYLYHHRSKKSPSQKSCFANFILKLPSRVILFFSLKPTIIIIIIPRRVDKNNFALRPSTSLTHSFKNYPCETRNHLAVGLGCHVQPDGVFPLASRENSRSGENIFSAGSSKRGAKRSTQFGKFSSCSQRLKLRALHTLVACVEGSKSGT